MFVVTFTRFFTQQKNKYMEIYNSLVTLFETCLTWDSGIPDLIYEEVDNPVTLEQYETLRVVQNGKEIVRLRHEGLGHRDLLAAGVFAYILHYGLKPTTETIKPPKKIIHGN